MSVCVCERRRVREMCVHKCWCGVCVVFWLTVYSLQRKGSAWQDGEIWKGLCICIRVGLWVSVCLGLSVHLCISLVVWEVCVLYMCLRTETNVLLDRWKEEVFRHASLRQATNLSVCVCVCLFSFQSQAFSFPSLGSCYRHHHVGINTRPCVCLSSQFYRRVRAAARAVGWRHAERDRWGAVE